MTSFLTTILGYFYSNIWSHWTYDSRIKIIFDCVLNGHLGGEQASLCLVMGTQKQFKIVIIGDPCVGKTCLLTLFTNGTCKRHLGPIL